MNFFEGTDSPYRGRKRQSLGGGILYNDVVSSIKKFLEAFEKKVPSNFSRIFIFQA